MADLRNILTDMYREHGKLTPPIVVDEARDETHPLHHRFEWDDSVAGERYREVQAAQLIRSVRVKYTDPQRPDEETSIRAFHAVYKPGANEAATDSSYLPLDEVQENPLLAQMLLQQAEREWRQMRARYGHLERFLALVREDVAA